MPFDAMIVSAGVVAMFLAFAVVLLWGDAQTRPDRLNADSRSAKTPRLLEPVGRSCGLNWR